MARIRSIKPEFWTSAQVIECSRDARLLFIGLWNFSDDAGRHADNVKQLKAEIFPSDDLSSENVLGMLNELVGNGLVSRYDVDGKAFLQVTGWHNQRIDKPQPARHPPPPANPINPPPAPSIPRTFQERSRLIGRDRKGKDRKKRESKTDVVHPLGINLDAWMRWLEYRKGIGKPIKPASAQAAIDQLAKFGDQQKEVVEQSIANGWQGLFAIKGATFVKLASPSQTKFDRFREQLEAVSMTDEEDAAHVARIAAQSKQAS